jgi:hypothetical protein
MGGLGAPELLIITFLLFFAVLPIWGIVDAAMRPNEAWAATGQSKALWIILQFVLGVIGAIIYFLAIRPKLAAATAPPNIPPPPAY